MPLKYYDAAKKMRTANPKASYYNDYAAIVDLTFDNAPNIAYNEVEYEQTYGKNDFAIVPKVRVDVILDYNTGIILGDDYKTFIFPPDFPATPYYGMKFRWNNSYWLVINTNNLESMVVSAEVRRCNNVLRFYDNEGNRIEEPCIMDYTLRFANNKLTAPITYGNGEQKVWCQRNKRTELIRPNDRFLFGTPEQRVCFRVYAGGIKNYMNNATEDDNSPTITEFYINHYEANPLFDDFKDGFANAYFNDITIQINNPIESLNVGDEVELMASVFKGQNEIETSVLWESSEPDIIDITNNIATAKSLGSATITAYLEDNQNITSSFIIDVVEEVLPKTYEIVINPNTLYVLQDTSKTFAVNLYENGVLQQQPIVIRNVTVDVPDEKYEIIGGKDNTFTVVNKEMYMDAPLLIECSYQDTVKVFKIYLRGLY